MFEESLIMLSSNSNKIKTFMDILKSKNIPFRIETFDDGRQVQKCIYVGFWYKSKATKLFKKFKETYKN